MKIYVLINIKRLNINFNDSVWKLQHISLFIIYPVSDNKNKLCDSLLLEINATELKKCYNLIVFPGVGNFFTRFPDQCK